jgi:hypothetical protein
MRSFLEANPGTASRFPTTVNFPDYTDDELMAIFCQAAAQAGFELAAGTAERARSALAAAPRGPGFGNGRAARTVLEEAISCQGERLASADPGGGPPAADAIRTLVPADIRMPDKPSTRPSVGFQAASPRPASP